MAHPPPSPRYRPRIQPRRQVLAAVLAAACVMTVWLVWQVAVASRAGQVWDHEAAQVAESSLMSIHATLRPALTVVSVPFLLIAIGALAAMGLARREFWRTGAAVGVVAGANITTRLLKAHLERPALGVDVGAPNSLPSGHTTVAASLSLAVLFVTPPRWRPWVACLGATYTAATGMGTITEGWHRISDAIAAIAVTGAWALLAIAVLGPQALATRRPLRVQSRRSAYAVGVSVLTAGIALGATAALVGWIALSAAEDPLALGSAARAAIALAQGAAIFAAVATVSLAIVTLGSRTPPAVTIAPPR